MLFFSTVHWPLGRSLDAGISMFSESPTSGLVRLGKWECISEEGKEGEKEGRERKGKRMGLGNHMTVKSHSNFNACLESLQFSNLYSRF